MKSNPRLLLNGVLLGFLMLFGSGNGLFAAVEAVIIELKGDLTAYRYRVPEGKVLIVEHLGFNDYWASQSEPMEVVLMYSFNPVGSVWQTTLRYTTPFNSLLRPIKLPEDTGIAIKVFTNTLYKCFLFGSLVDQSDLYAGVSSEIQDIHVHPLPSGQAVEGHVELASARPSTVALEESADLHTWTPLTSAVEFSNTSVQSRHFEFVNSTKLTQQFLRARTQARASWLPPPPTRNRNTLEEGQGGN